MVATQNPRITCPVSGLDYLHTGGSEIARLDLVAQKKGKKPPSAGCSNSSGKIFIHPWPIFFWNSLPSLTWKLAEKEGCWLALFPGGGLLRLEKIPGFRYQVKMETDQNKKNRTMGKNINSNQPKKLLEILQRTREKPWVTIICSIALKGWTASAK